MEMTGQPAFFIHDLWEKYGRNHKKQTQYMINGEYIRNRKKQQKRFRKCFRMRLHGKNDQK